jgi:ribosomal protein L11 methyltransferase
MRLAVPLARLSRAGATIVLSGLLPGHANAALAIYRAQSFVLERRILLDGWATLVLRKENRPGRGRPRRHRRLQMLQRQQITSRRTAYPFRRN